MTEEEYRAFLARTEKQAAAPVDAVAVESDLHDQIMADIRRRGWLAIHSRMDMATTTAIGVPDFVIMGDGGRVWWIECKARGGKVSNSQMAFHAMAAKLGHRVVVVWNFAEYASIVGGE
jgi:hypothetical protein